MASNSGSRGARRCRVVFLSGTDQTLCDRAIECFGTSDVTVVRDRAALERADGDILFSFGSSLIVSAEILRRFDGRAYNLHAASPEYPGRDPHHWACYDGAVRYGATLHVMSKRVDEGPIVDVEWFDVAAGTTPAALLADANNAAIAVLRRNAGKMRGEAVLNTMQGTDWATMKHSRADLFAICQLPLDISAAEFFRRVHAFDGEAYQNLTISLFGRTFRIEADKSGPPGPSNFRQ